MAYDIIGDIHGQTEASSMRYLANCIGTAKGAYRHPNPPSSLLATVDRPAHGRCL